MSTLRMEIISYIIIGKKTLSIAVIWQQKRCMRLESGQGVGDGKAELDLSICAIMLSV